MTRARERRLTARLEEAYRIAGNETGYWGNYFLRSVRQLGGLATAKKLLSGTAGGVSKGFKALVSAGRADLAVENIVLEPQFASLFTADERRRAKARLDQLPATAFPALRDPGDCYPDEQVEGVPEGAKKSRRVNWYERNTQNRAACIRLHGTRCSVCDMSFAERYGKELGEGFIHVHHVVPLSARRRRRTPDPKTELVPVCPNCHAMLHRRNGRPYRVEEVRRRLGLGAAPRSRRVSPT